MKENRDKRIKARCSSCGHPVNVFYQENATCRGVFLRCKNKNCRKIFELRI